MQSDSTRPLNRLVKEKLGLLREWYRLKLNNVARNMGLPLFLFGLLGSAWYWSHSSSSDREYEQKILHAEKVADPWQRFTQLSDGVDPNAWARAWKYESEANQKWALATYLAIQEAVRAGDPRARDYLTKGQYCQYASLQELRDELGQR
jgi:hypothetical protein